MAQCTAKSKATGEQCRRRAVTGFSVCQVHGAGSVLKGRVGGAPIRTGRYSLKHRASLDEKVREFEASPMPGDLTGELALTRALLQDFLERYPDGVPMPLKDIEAIYRMTETIGRTVERIAKVMNQTALTQAEVKMLEGQLLDLVVKYIDNPERRLAFANELQSAFGTGGRTGKTSNALSNG